MYYYLHNGWWDETQTVTRAREERQIFSLNKISMTKSAFRISIETLSIAEQTYMPLKKPVFYLIIRKQLWTFAAVLLWELLSEDIDNKNIIVVRFEAREARENFESLRSICQNSVSLRNICDRKWLQ